MFPYGGPDIVYVLFHAYKVGLVIDLGAQVNCPMIPRCCGESGESIGGLIPPRSEVEEVYAVLCGVKQSPFIRGGMVRRDPLLLDEFTEIWCQTWSLARIIKQSFRYDECVLNGLPKADMGCDRKTLSPSCIRVATGCAHALGWSCQINGGKHVRVR